MHAYVCVCVYMCACMRVCIYVCVCTYVCIPVYVCTCMERVCVRKCVTCVRECKFMYAWCVYVDMRAYLGTLAV